MRNSSPFRSFIPSKRCAKPMMQDNAYLERVGYKNLWRNSKLCHKT